MKTLHNIPISKRHLINTLSQYFDISNIHSWHIHKTLVIYKFSISQYPLNIIISMSKITISQCRNSQLSKYPNVNIIMTYPKCYTWNIHLWHKTIQKKLHFPHFQYTQRQYLNSYILISQNLNISLSQYLIVLLSL